MSCWDKLLGNSLDFVLFRVCNKADSTAAFYYLYVFAESKEGGKNYLNIPISIKRKSPWKWDASLIFLCFFFQYISGSDPVITRNNEQNAYLMHERD